MPGGVPEEPFGIGNAEFNAGQMNAKYGYPILELYELIKPITLNEMKSTWSTAAPMGWSYLKEGMWCNRWGGDEGREDRLKQII